MQSRSAQFAPISAPAENHRALDRAAGADAYVLAEHDQAADMGPRSDVHATLDHRGGNHPAVDLRVLGDRQPALAEPRAHAVSTLPSMMSNVPCR